MKNRICEVCSAAFTIKAGSQGRACSTTCAKVLSLETQRLNRERKDQERRLAYADNPHLCKHCGGVIAYDKRQNKFCSQTCSATYNNIAGTTYNSCIICMKPTLKDQWCGPECKKQHRANTKPERDHLRRMRGRETYARYSAKKKYQTPIGADLAAIKTFYENCPPGYEVDHKVPISKGGLHSIENLQYLTKSDNRKKGAKLDWCPQGDSNT